MKEDFLVVAPKSMPRYFYAVDPGKKRLAVAKFSGRSLERVNFVERSENPAHFSFHDLYVEWPATRGSRTKNANDLLELTYMLGRMSTGAQNVHRIKPGSWKGTIKKAIVTKRILNQDEWEGPIYLTPAEYELLRPEKFNHNLVDAVGLGLWLLKRYP